MSNEDELTRVLEELEKYISTNGYMGHDPYDALNSPLLDVDISNAKGALVNVVGGPSPPTGR